MKKLRTRVPCAVSIPEEPADIHREVRHMDKESREMFEKILNRLDVIELKQDRTDRKLEDLRLDVAVAVREIRRDIFELKDEMGTVIEVLKMNELLPQ